MSGAGNSLMSKTQFNFKIMWKRYRGRVLHLTGRWTSNKEGIPFVTLIFFIYKRVLLPSVLDMTCTGLARNKHSLCADVWKVWMWMLPVQVCLLHPSLKLVQGGWRLFSHLPKRLGQMAGPSRKLSGAAMCTNKWASQHWTLNSFSIWSNNWENRSWPRSALSQLYLKSMSIFNPLVNWKELGWSSV